MTIKEFISVLTNPYLIIKDYEAIGFILQMKDVSVKTNLRHRINSPLKEDGSTTLGDIEKFDYGRAYNRSKTGQLTEFLQSQLDTTLEIILSAEDALYSQLVDSSVAITDSSEALPDQSPLDASLNLQNHEPNADLGTDFQSTPAYRELLEKSEGHTLIHPDHPLPHRSLADRQMIADDVIDAKSPGDLDSLVSGSSIEEIQDSNPQTLDRTTELADNTRETNYIAPDITSRPPTRNEKLYAKPGTLVGRIFNESYGDLKVEELFGIKGTKMEGIIIDSWRIRGSLVPMENEMYTGEDLVRFAFKMRYADFFRNVGYEGESDEEVLQAVRGDMTDHPIDYPSTATSRVASPKKDKISEGYSKAPKPIPKAVQKTSGVRYSKRPKISSPETQVPVSQDRGTDYSSDIAIVRKYFPNDPHAFALVRKMQEGPLDWNYANRELPKELGTTSVKVFGILERLMDRELATMDDRQRFILNPPLYRN